MSWTLSGKERGAELSTESPPGGELDPLAEEEVGQTWQTQTYCEGSVGNVWPSPLSGRSSTPTSGRASHRFRGSLGTLSLSGPCSLPPLSTRQFEVVDARSLVRACRGGNFPKPGGGHRKYRQAKQATARRRVLEAKTWVWEEFGEAMEEEYRLASKRFWQTVQRLRRGKQYSANTVYSAGGELLTLTGDIVGWRCKKYFEDLLNPTDLPSNEEAEAGVSEVNSSHHPSRSH
ncbi:hypothetical protein L3Q82_009832 [Scortum barcoo]|uniref:Uncharacterized protein n=1 Tax=Scortum barcoo TaxID=214431 RepID=A0ACB8WD87_9TELE|nr:hypothetical protein L3Q82_009832 [Scortum barcoo]